MTEKRALSRPALPEIAEPLRWRRSVSVFGARAEEFAVELARVLGARLVRVELRHAEGFVQKDDVLYAHPSVLKDAIASAMDDRITVGVGSAFAAAVTSDLAVFVRAGESPLALSPVERRLARDARLMLEEPRIRTAQLLGEMLAAGFVESADL